MVFLLYPLYLISFWYIDVTKSFISFFVGLNRYIASLLSVTLMIKTLFKPLKNEYRDGLVLFSRVMGIIVKTSLLVVSVGIISLVIVIEVFVLITIVLLPPFVFSLLFLSSQFS